MILIERQKGWKHVSRIHLLVDFCSVMRPYLYRHLNSRRPLQQALLVLVVVTAYNVKPKAQTGGGFFG